MWELKYWALLYQYLLLQKELIDMQNKYHNSLKCTLGLLDENIGYKKSYLRQAHVSLN